MHRPIAQEKIPLACTALHTGGCFIQFIWLYRVWAFMCGSGGSGWLQPLERMLTACLRRLSHKEPAGLSSSPRAASRGPCACWAACRALNAGVRPSVLPSTVAIAHQTYAMNTVRKDPSFTCGAALVPKLTLTPEPFSSVLSSAHSHKACWASAAQAGPCVTLCCCWPCCRCGDAPVQPVKEVEVRPGAEEAQVPQLKV